MSGQYGRREGLGSKGSTGFEHFWWRTISRQKSNDIFRERINTRFNRKAVIITGELSGEMHAADLVQALNRIVPFEFSGIGSKRLAATGVRVIQGYEQISLVGLSEIFSKISHIRRAYQLTKSLLATERPSLLILIDFPGFNLRIAKMAHGLGIPIVYFIPPQVWAWHKSRINQIKKYVDLVLCILPFEEPLYKDAGIPVSYVGHPFVRTVKPTRAREEFLSEIGIKTNSKVLSILPGSRENEIVTHLPLLLQTADLIQKQIPEVVVLMPLSDYTKDALVARFLNNSRMRVLPLRGRTYDALAASDAAVIVSGSATLEAALLGVPTVVVYRVSCLSYVMARLLVNVRFISLPNLIANKCIFPEHIQRIKPEMIAKDVLSMLKNGTGSVREELRKVSKSLGGRDSYSLAAEEIIGFLENIYGTLS